MCALVDSWLVGLKRAPILHSARLLLRPVCVGDVVHIQSSIDDKRVCDNLSYVPHPYTVEMAETWTRNVNFGMANGSCCYWTICDQKTEEFIGSMGLSIHNEQDGCEMHYWVNADQWNKGYCTEAAKRTIVHAFEDIGMHRVFITHRENGLASKTVIKKCGFVLEGILRDSLKRFGKFENVATYSMLHDEYLAMKKNGLY
ncbi:MAG: GNAT family N-acetyltransferase [Puniceicoccales bacterium]|jgi:RimJ/RimL family protein N-acetyltransferase|nr:GNAT family N-acetyltransferase [Puniceicoccales bacterium]